MNELEQVITAYGYRDEVSYDSLIEVYGPRSENRLAYLLQMLLDSGKILEFVRDGKRWYRIVSSAQNSVYILGFELVFTSKLPNTL